MESSAHQVFFTEAAFERYSVSQPTFRELLEKYAPRQANNTFEIQSRNEKGFKDASTKPTGPHHPLACPKAGFIYPRYSNLTHDQHRRYLSLEEKYSGQSLQGKHTIQQIHELREFRQFQTSVANEQREFQQFAERIARSCKEDYEFLHPLAKAYMKSAINQYQERLRSHPQNYALYQAIGMSVEPVIPSDPVLKHMACLVSLGQAPAMKIEAVNPQNEPVLHHMVSVKEGATPMQDSIQIVSEDANAKKLAEKYHANIVVSYSALETLLDTHPPPFEQQWEIPITVCKHGDGPSTSFNTIYMDKPLKQKIIFPHDASKIFHQAVLQHFLSINPSSPIEVDLQDECVERFLQSGVEFNAGRKKDEKGLDFESTSDADALLELETFGSGLILPFPKQIGESKDTKDAVHSKQECSQDESEMHSKQTSLNTPSDPENALPSPKQSHSPENTDIKVTDESSNSNKVDHTSNNINNTSHADSRSSSSTMQATVAMECEKTSDIKNASGVDDIIRDSPQSPPPEDTGAMTLEMIANGENTLVEGTWKESPESPPPVETEHDEDIQDREDTRPIQSNPNVVSPPRNNVSIARDSSASEMEGDLVIASPPRAVCSQEDKAKQCDSSSNTEESPKITDDQVSNSPVLNARTRRSKRLQMSTVGKDTDDEDDDSGVVTRRRSSRLRKADAPPSEESPAKKMKQKDAKSEEKCPVQEVKGESESSKENTECIEKTGGEENVSVDRLQSRSASTKPEEQNLDTKTHDAEEKVSTKPEEQKPATKCQDEESMPSVDSKTSETSISSNPADVKKTGTPVTTNPPAKKPRGRTMMKSQSVKGSKAGGVSSTIDTIMKLQEALHTRRQQRVVPPLSSPTRGRDSKTDSKQNPLHEKPENPEDYQCPNDGNVSYNLWRLGKMNVLIRTRDHGVISQGEATNHQMFPVTVIPKMEYQTHFGFEQPSLSELCQIWSNLYIRPGSKVIRGRVNAMTSQLMRVDWLDLTSPLWGQCPLNPARSMKMVHAIFDKLQDLPEGRYMLSHNPGDSHASVHLALEEGSKKRVTYDLHTAHNQPTLQLYPSNVLPWIPLDPNVPTQATIEKSTIPLTFPPRLPGMKVGPPPKKKNKAKKKKNNNNAKTS